MNTGTDLLVASAIVALGGIGIVTLVAVGVKIGWVKAPPEAEEPAGQPTQIGDCLYEIEAVLRSTADDVAALRRQMEAQP